jgi:hypothetical protein
VTTAVASEGAAVKKLTPKQHAYALMLVGVGLLGIAGIVTTRLNGQWVRAEELQAVPKQVALSDLGSVITEDGRHVLVTGFFPGKGHVRVVFTEFITGREKNWVEGWVPLFPVAPDAKGNAPDPEEPPAFTALLLTRDVADKEAAIERLKRCDSIDVLAYSPGTRLEGSKFQPDVSRKLSNAYPDTDFSQCIILQEVRPGDASSMQSEAKFTTGAIIACYLAGGAILTVGLVKWRRTRRSAKERSSVDDDDPPSRRPARNARDWDEDADD